MMTLGNQRAFLMILVGATWSFQGALAETTGCYMYGYRFETAPFSDGANMPITDVLDKHACQEKCLQYSGCQQWAYIKKNRACWLGGAALQLVADATAVSGPKVCPAVPGVCTDLPGSGFPSSTIADTFKAWPSGLQPPPLQCWPRGADDELLPCPGESATVLEDFNKGWPGKCWGLTQVAEPTNETCAESCERRLDCPAYQTVTSGDPDSGLLIQCWQGLGYRCNDEGRTGVQILAARRYMHGNYRVLKSLINITINGLLPVFAASTASSKEEAEAIQECNQTCLSVTSCEAWQYSRVYGCYVDAPQDSGVTIGYPGTTPNVFTSNRSFDDTVLAGEYIQRFCGPQPQNPNKLMASSSAIVSWAPQSGIEVTDATMSTSTRTTTTTAATTSTKSLDVLAEAARAAAVARSEQEKEDENKIAAAAAAALAKGRAEAAAAFKATSTTAAPGSSGWGWFLWLILAILLILAISLFAIAAFFYMRGQKGRSRKRAMKLADTEYDRVMHLADAEYDCEYDRSQDRASFFSLPSSFPDSEAQELQPMSHQPLFGQAQVHPIPQYRWIQPAQTTDPIVDAANRLFDAIDSNHDGFITRDEFSMYRQPTIA